MSAVGPIECPSCGLRPVGEFLAPLPARLWGAPAHLRLLHRDGCRRVVPWTVPTIPAALLVIDQARPAPAAAAEASDGLDGSDAEGAASSAAETTAAEPADSPAPDATPSSSQPFTFNRFSNPRHDVPSARHGVETWRRTANPPVPVDLRNWRPGHSGGATSGSDDRPAAPGARAVPRGRGGAGAPSGTPR